MRIRVTGTQQKKMYKIQIDEKFTIDGYNSVDTQENQGRVSSLITFYMVTELITEKRSRQIFNN